VAHPRIRSNEATDVQPGTSVRIFVGMTEIAGYFTNLTRGFRELGVECTFFCLWDSFRYAEQLRDHTQTRTTRLLRAAYRRRASVHRWNLPSRACWDGLIRLSWLTAFVQAIRSNDVFIFTFGQSFSSRYWDLPLLRLLGKQVLFVFTGTDHRPPYLNGVFQGDHPKSPSELVSLSRELKARLKTIERYAEFVVGHHLSAHFHEKPLIAFQLMGVPYLPPGVQSPRAESENSAPLRIVHAPSRPQIKGTAVIRSIVQNLLQKGRNIQLIELSGRPNSEVLEELSRCDFVIDEVYSDTRFAGLSTEAAAYGRPTVVAGYASDAHFGIPGVLEKEDFPPIHYCHPEELEAAIDKLITDPDYRVTLGERARRYVEARWTPREVARRYLLALNGDAPRSWFYDPRRIRYVHGYGISETRLAALLKEFLACGGVEALQLSDKPDLKSLFVKLSRGAPNSRGGRVPDTGGSLGGAQTSLVDGLDGLGSDCGPAKPETP
jgi:glycosyltransferase involved in cell wall biosynthesis